MSSAASSIAYPPGLETWWLQRAAAARRKPAGAPLIRSFAPEVARLSDAFTVKREASAIAMNEKAWLAYGLFFFPQTFMRLRFILNELRQRGFVVPEHPRVLDLGAGSGAATAALIESGVRPSEITLLDQSTVGLDLAYPLLREHYNVNARTTKGDLKDPPHGTWDVILVSYAINESLASATDADIAEWLRVVRNRLSPTGLLLLCEPLVEHAGPFMDRIRTAALAAGGLHLWAPCPHQGACPLAAKRQSCHDVRNWRMPPAAQTLNNLLHRSIENLKFTFLALSPVAPKGAGAAFRIVAPVQSTKGKWELVGCAGDATLKRYEVLKRDIDTATRRRMDALERGEMLELQDLAPAGDAWRGRLSPDVAPSP